jgi:hypothetical protein
MKKIPNIWKLYNTTVNNPWMKEQIKIEFENMIK